MDTIHFWQAFKNTAQIKNAFLGTITLQQQKLGDLVVSTGHIVVCDPFVFPDSLPFQIIIPPGNYPLIAYIATFATDNDHRIAYVQLQITSQQPVRWEQATCSGQNIQSLKEDQCFGYSVDAGMACFMDCDAAAELQKRFAIDPDYSESLIQASLSQEDINIILNPSTGANSIIFSSGWGDGFYTSYWGYDAEDNIACLVTDFALLNHPIISGRNIQKSEQMTQFWHGKRRLLELCHDVLRHLPHFIMGNFIDSLHSLISS